MTFEADPPRLLAPDSGASPALREVLGSAVEDGPSAQQLARLTARMTPQLVGSTVLGSATIAIGKVLAVASLVSLAGVASWSALSRDGARPSPSIVQAPPATPASSATARPPTLELADRPILGPPPPQIVRPEVVRRPRQRDRGSGDEATLLSAAHRALRSGDPSRAFDLTREHDRRFGAGSLLEEREAIAIEALVQLGRRGAATRRFEAFDKRFGGSSYRRRLERLLTLEADD